MSAEPLATTTDRARTTDDGSRVVRWSLISSALLVVVVFIVLPQLNVFYEAFAGGLAAYLRNLFTDPATRHSIFLTLLVTVPAVAANLVFGIAAAWAIARFRFPGRTVLVTLIDVSISVSPVVAGLMFVLLFGSQGYFGPWLMQHGIKVLFATPGLILVTTFVTLPFIVRELLPVMEANGPEEELAARSLGASGWQMFWKVTLPNIKWGLFYGLILCTARAMGEFGAVYVVSGRIIGQTATIPLQVNLLWEGNNTPGAFALASVLTLIAVGTLFAKARLKRPS
jgi:sulfate transport system permease protein